MRLVHTVDNFKYYYQIWDRKKEIGYLAYTVRGQNVIIGILEINPEFQGQGYGYKIVEYLLKRYPTKSIIGETLPESRGFWRKCILKYNGVRKNVHYTDNCTSAFLIPKKEIAFDVLMKCLETAYEIT